MLRLITRALHAFQPETAHRLSMAALRLVPTIYDADDPNGQVELMGLSFPNRVGLAAGFDKNGDHIDNLAKLGFGFIEIGTITPKPQQGSPKPRLFRIPDAEALINRMGFNNLGVEHAARNLARQGRSFGGILGCNIGCNRDTPSDKTNEDYLHCLRRLYGLANYYVVNISSPNTPKLRNMQRPLPLRALLNSLVDLREELSANHREKAPLLVKVAPDQRPGQIRAMAEVISSTGIEGVVATNTTTTRPREVASLPYGGQPGGMSGKPLRELADSSLATWRECLPKDSVIIGVGGVFSGSDAKAKIKAGANLVQVYTGLTYMGPSLVSECARSTSSTTRG